MISTGQAIERKRSHMPRKPWASRRMEERAASVSTSFRPKKGRESPPPPPPPPPSSFFLLLRL